MCVCVCVCVCVCARARARARSPTTGAGGGDANHDATLNVALKHGHVIARVASHKALVRLHAKESLPHVRQRQALAGGGGHYIHKKAAVGARDVAVASACDSRLAWCVRSSCQTTPCVAGARCLFFSLPAFVVRAHAPRLSHADPPVTVCSISSGFCSHGASWSGGSYLAAIKSRGNGGHAQKQPCL